ncbi:hypothetical protein V8G54_016210, partial [Vigna mungo]
RCFIRIWLSTVALSTFQNLPFPSFLSHFYFFLFFYCLLLLSNVIVPYLFNTCSNVYNNNMAHITLIPSCFVFFFSFDSNRRPKIFFSSVHCNAVNYFNCYKNLNQNKIL